jgi:hypothetical protein
MIIHERGVAMPQKTKQTMRVRNLSCGSGKTVAMSPPELETITKETIGIRYTAVISASSLLRFDIL